MHVMSSVIIIFHLVYMLTIKGKQDKHAYHSVLPPDCRGGMPFWLEGDQGGCHPGENLGHWDHPGDHPVRTTHLGDWPPIHRDRETGV